MFVEQVVPHVSSLDFCSSWTTQVEHGLWLYSCFQIVCDFGKSVHPCTI